MTADYETLTLSDDPSGATVLTLNRPQAANAVNSQMATDIADAVWQLVGSGRRCIVLTGAGDRAFCAGADLKERHGMTDADWFEQHKLYRRMISAVLNCPLPVIAAINGAAFGGGCELALCADFIYASSNARFALTEVSLGIMPGSGGTQTLPRAVGMRRAKELIFTGEVFTADKAAQWGLVNRVTEPGDLLNLAKETAGRIAANAPMALRQAKKSMDSGIHVELQAALAIELDCYNLLVPSRDRREGIAAYNEKRKPVFDGS